MSGKTMKMADKTGLLIQGVTVLLSLYILYSGQWAGLLLLIPAVLVDCVLKGPKREALTNPIKILLLFQGVMVWIVMSTQSSTIQLFKESDNVFSKTTNIVARSPQSEYFGHRPVVDHSPTLNKNIVLNNNNADIARANNMVPDDQRLSDTVSADSLEIIQKAFDGSVVPVVDFPDLKYRPREEVRQQLRRVFEEIPAEGFKSGYKNPCWNFNPNDYPLETVEHTEQVGGVAMGVACLPYVYVLGQPKCGTSDLFERLKRHPDIRST